VATEKEKALVAELSDLAIAVNEQGKVNVSLDIRASGIDMRIHDVKHMDFDYWLYHSNRPAYFSDDIFSEDDFIAKANEFRHVLRVQHKSFDADGVKL
jgi:uncharacterized 2Fe-2S/4Fe-4S cluster protein (DUF4445 family)